MSQPFVMSLKLVGEDAGASAVVDKVKREVVELRAVATNLMAGGTSVDIDRMLGIKAGGGSVDEYTQALDRLRGQLVPVAGLERQHDANLAMIANAYKIGAISADEQTAAIARENAAHQRAIAALDGHTHAININAAANGRAMAQRANLIFQLNDIFVSLAGGMNPAMVAIQQGSQISTIYGPGGLGKALSETGSIATGVATKFWPIAVAAAAVGVAIGGIRGEIEETSGVAVSFGDVFMAIFQVLGGYLYNAFRPQIEAVADWFAWMWDQVVQFTKDAVNFIIGSVMLFLEQIRLVHEIVPQVFKLAGEMAANFFIEAIQHMVNQTLAGVDNITQGFNALFGTDLKLTPKLDLEQFKFDTDKAGADVVGTFQRYQDTVAGILSTDYAGDFFSDVQTQAIKNYNAGLDETAKKAKDAASGLKNTQEAMKALQAEIDFYKGTFRSFLQEFRSGLAQGKTFWEALGNAGASALDKIADRAMGMLADGIFDMIFGAILGGGNATGGILNNILGGGPVRAGFNLPGYAGGTDNHPGGLARVFEEGGEIINLPSGSQVIPHDVSMSMAANDRGSFVFSPVSHFHGLGSGATRAEFQAMLDQRDEALNAQFAARVAEVMDNPRRAA